MNGYVNNPDFQPVPFYPCDFPDDLPDGFPGDGRPDQCPSGPACDVPSNPVIPAREVLGHFLAGEGEDVEHRYFANLPPLEGDPKVAPWELVAHFSALQKVTLPEPPSQPLLTIPHDAPLVPAVWADVEGFIFDKRPVEGLTPAELHCLLVRSNHSCRRVVVLVGTPTEEQVATGCLRVEFAPDPETAWQSAWWYLSYYNPRWQIVPSA